MLHSTESNEVGGIERTCCGNLKLSYRTLRQLSRKQCFIVPAQTQQTHVKRLSPENKGVSPYMPWQTAYRSKHQDLNIDDYMQFYRQLCPSAR
jgi:hypothetical protein